MTSDRDKLVPGAYTEAPPTYSQIKQPPYNPNLLAPATGQTPPPPYHGYQAGQPAFPQTAQPLPQQRTTVIVTERTVYPTTHGGQPIVVNPCLWIYVIVAIIFCPVLGCIALCFLLAASSDQESARYGQALQNARISRIFASLGITLSLSIIIINVILSFTGVYYN